MWQSLAGAVVGSRPYDVFCFGRTYPIAFGVSWMAGWLCSSYMVKCVVGGSLHLHGGYRCYDVLVRIALFGR